MSQYEVDDVTTVLLPVAYVHSHGAWIVQTSVDQDCSVRPVQFGHLYGLPVEVTPVQVSSQPINSQTIWFTDQCVVKDLSINHTCIVNIISIF